MKSIMSIESLVSVKRRRWAGPETSRLPAWCLQRPRPPFGVCKMLGKGRNDTEGRSLFV